MMPLLAAGVVTIGGSVALSLIAKATVVTAFAMVAGRLARRRRAAVSHLIFAVAFAVLALLLNRVNKYALPLAAARLRHPMPGHVAVIVFEPGVSILAHGPDPDQMKA